MSELLKALQAAAAAAAVGFDAPRCGRCNGSAVATIRACQKVHDCGDEPDQCDPPACIKSCHRCHATGLDDSDPERLLGRAMAWFWLKGYDICDRPLDYCNPGGKRCLKVVMKVVMEDVKEPHNKTAKDRATAILRLVARVGGAA